MINHYLSNSFIRFSNRSSEPRLTRIEQTKEEISGALVQGIIKSGEKLPLDRIDKILGTAVKGDAIAAILEISNEHPELIKKEGTRYIVQ